MIQKRLSSSIKFLSLPVLILAFYMLSSCNRIKEVEVQVIDVESMAGIDNINIFYGDKQYVTDNNGKVIIEGRNMKGTEVSINRDIRGYTTPDFYKNCSFQQVYPIESEVLIIGLEKFRVLKLAFSLDNNKNEIQGCSRITSAQNCTDASVAFEFVKTKTTLEVPGMSGWNETQNSITFFMHKNIEPWKAEFFFNTKEDCSYTEKQPIQKELILMDPNQDTTFFTVKLK
ncbi:MAG: hypothetical protein KDC83_14840 [Flavobacteriales bacterium]|nr:hypothetical protein [Flavobacteriales bacterium]